MDQISRRLRVEQLDRKLAQLQVLREVEPPSRGWIHSTRMTLNMSLAQLARRLGKTPPSVKEIEVREQDRTITLKKLIEVGEALDLQFVYGFLPARGSIEEMIEERALQVARDIVMRTSHTMALEDQQVSEERLRKAIRERAASIQREMPRYLWD
jgi:predicted DNA-binding mobile mystery protein A